MKYICLGYFDESKWETMSESEQRAFMAGLAENAANAYKVSGS
jgi:hypothetical protein